MRRKGESPGGRHFRSDRFVQTNGAWYFSTREQIDVGPFKTRHDAVKASEKLIEHLAAAPDDAAAKKIIEDFVTFQVARYSR
jgi:Domain of unknown function (DUF6316)